MNTPHSLGPALSLLLGFCGILATRPAARAATGNEEVVAVSSRASKNYIRAKLPDGTFQPETYAFGNGGHVGGSISDDTIDKLGFMDVARIIAKPLADRKYLPTSEPSKTNLLVMVYWGTTSGTKDTTNSLQYQNAQYSQAVALPLAAPPGKAAGTAPNTAQSIDDEAVEMMMMVNRQRDDADMKNAMLLGYDSELIATKGLENTPLRGYRNDLIDDLEDNRYFVVLMAYDFQMVWKEKKHKLLWVTRISLRQRGNDFGKDLPAMMQYASRYFGEETDGLVRNPVPEGHVEVGEPKSLGVVPEK